jgi:hypothetical protein
VPPHSINRKSRQPQEGTGCGAKATAAGSTVNWLPGADSDDSHKHNTNSRQGFVHDVWEVMWPTHPGCVGRRGGEVNALTVRQPCASCLTWVRSLLCTPAHALFMCGARHVCDVECAEPQGYSKQQDTTPRTPAAVNGTLVAHTAQHQPSAVHLSALQVRTSRHKGEGST